jgi:hypothetical protein
MSGLEVSVLLLGIAQIVNARRRPVIGHETRHWTTAREVDAADGDAKG